MRCEFVGCHNEADWQRPAGALPAALRCDDCTPYWRVREYLPLTATARERRERMDRADLPQPRTKGA